MKTKSFLLFSTSVFAISLFLILFHSQPPHSIQDIVSQTQQHIKDFQENLRDVEGRHMVQEERYLKLVGVAAWHNVTRPVLVTHARADQHALAVSFVRAALALPYSVLVYNIGLSPYSLSVVSSYCNSSKCTIVELDLSEFPSHVADESIHAFRPLVIQHALSVSGGVVFAEPGSRWRGGAAALASLWTRASRAGVLAWPRRAAVTSLTHPRMFHYLRAAPDDFLFVQQVGADRLLVSATPDTDQLMRAWLACALTLDCIMPIGAQSAGCRFDKKPQYRYSGCHGQDASALSIILGLRWGFEEAHYCVRESPRRPLWSRVSPAEARAELDALTRNTTGADDAARPTHPPPAPAA